MELPLQITFRDVPPSPAVEARIREEAETLFRFFDQIVRCRVTVEMPHRRHRQGALYAVRIELAVPGPDLVIGREPSGHHAHEDVYVAVRDAFAAATRQLQDRARVQRAAVKRHEPASEGRVARLARAEGYGFIETADGREVYFHRNSVVGDSFDRLDVGTAVRFAEELGEQGPQASTVHARRRGAGGSRAAEGL
jgi:cold shock CspA family protein/ribosome-associated translation inhibitor RaiA